MSRPILLVYYIYPIVIGQAKKTTQERMKNIFYILILLTNLTFGQTVKQTAPEIEKYSKSIDKLKAENRLVKISYPNMSGCGGGLDGYYLNKKLVLIDATYGAELGFSSRTIYIDQDKFLKIIYREHFAEWGKYEKNYPSDKFEYDPTKMTYTDTVYTITLSNLTVFHKQSDNKIISTKLDQSLLERLISCGQQMNLELQEVTKQIDSLAFVKEMPYICETAICGDKLYWEAVSIGNNNIEFFIDKLDDTTLTIANVVLFGGNYTVADIAFSVLTELIHDIPTFELLGVPFDRDGCGYCSYWQHLNKDFSNRQKFKEAVRIWYHKSKDNLVWMVSNDFATCDCRGQHPNGGHYKLKTSKK
jgi:hypothetical protein